jgi:hypothetical protein
MPDPQDPATGERGTAPDATREAPPRRDAGAKPESMRDADVTNGENPET